MARSTKKSAPKKIAKKSAASKRPAKKSAPKKVIARKDPAAKKKTNNLRSEANAGQGHGAQADSAAEVVQAGQAHRIGHPVRKWQGIKGWRQTQSNVDDHRQSREAKGAPARSLHPSTKKEKLLQLRDAMVDSMAGVAQDTLRARAEGSEASAFGMHQADAGSDAYDRDFALSLLSQEQDALYEIDEALKRIDLGTYGKCEMSGKPILRARLEAIPFARFTVECQSQLEKQSKASRVRQSVTSTLWPDR